MGFAKKMYMEEYERWYMENKIYEAESEYNPYTSYDEQSFSHWETIEIEIENNTKSNTEFIDEDDDDELLPF